MKRYHRICLWVLAGILLLFLAGNLLLNSQSIPSGRPWRVEASRLAAQIEKGGLGSADLTQFRYITHVEPLENGSAASLLSAPENYLVVEAGGQCYRVDFTLSDAGPGLARLTLNLCLGAMTLLVLGVLLFVELRILRPFQSIQEAPFALATGNLTQPQKELKGRFFGKFIWGLDLLRETLEEQKSRELRLQKEKRLYFCPCPTTSKPRLPPSSSMPRPFPRACTRSLRSKKKPPFASARRLVRLTLLFPRSWMPPGMSRYIWR